MRNLIKLSLIFPLLFTLVGCETTQSSHNHEANYSAPETPKKSKNLPFAWPFLEPEMMDSRGGTSTGSEVTLATEMSQEWQSLKAPDLTSIEMDRRAILAMAGNYRVGFQFVETGGFTDTYAPPRPYFSWGTEHVFVIEDSDEFISLQHTLVMYMKDDSGKTMGPFVMKHWRQDWTYQNTDLHIYQGNRTWQRTQLDKNDVAGTWTQSVFQVDDSPRYEVVGKWKHEDQYSSWFSEASLRPLPRREYSVRDDYNILEGEHRITISPTGWIHEQHNRKVNRQKGLDTYVAQEIGFTRYERITDPDLSAAEESWQKVGPYWAAVRATWKNIFETHDRFQIKSDHEGSSLWEFHFSHAGEIEQADTYNETEWSQKARDTISRFLNSGDEIESSEVY